LSFLGVFSQSFSEVYNPNLPIAYLFDLPPLPAKKLLVNEYFRNDTTSSFTTICDSYTISNGIFTINLSVMAFGEIFMHTNISLQSDNLGIFNYITEINVTNPSTEERKNLKYQYTQQSAMEIILLFLNTITLFYDTEKLFSLSFEEASAMPAKVTLECHGARTPKTYNHNSLFPQRRITDGLRFGT
jgi:hypothetical protein